MNKRRIKAWSGSCAALMALLLAAPAEPHDPAPGGCGESSADLAHELAVMRSPAIPFTAEVNTSAQAVLALDKRYAISLIDQKQLRFRVKPGKGSRSEAARGGAFRFKVPAAGRYRVSITSRHWIDVVDGDSAVASVGHHGPGCDLVHKIVEFDLAAGHWLTLQVSGQDDAIIGLAITAAPTPSTQAGT